MTYWIVLIFHVVVMPFAVLHALMGKRDHRAAFGWIGVSVLFPVAGPLLYFVFGINRLHSKAKLFTGKHLPFMQLGFERAKVVPLHHRDPRVEGLPEPHLGAVGGRVTGAPLLQGNALEMLLDGEAFFPRLVGSIDNAQRFILVSSYLFSRRGVGESIVTALCRAAHRGVAVYVLLDGIGVWYSLRDVIRPLRRAGVAVALFMPPSLVPPSLGINLRNHRKIAVVDGAIAYFGGINLDQRHMVQDPHNPEPTEDVQFALRGPAVGALQELFVSDWWSVTRQTLELPAASDVERGATTCRVIDDGPDESLDFLAMTLIGIFTAARRDITLMVPYFLPNREMLAALQSAVLRGVRVRIILPERSNLRMVDWATRNMLWELIIWGVHIYYKPAPFAHTKLMLVDDSYVMGGSSNLDARSLRLNFELGVEMFGEAPARDVRAHVDHVLTSCREVTIEEVDARPAWQRMRDAFFWLFSSYL